MTKINATIRKLVGEKSIKKIKSQQEAFTCLKSTEEAILINNPKEFQLTILQTNQQDHFYLGFDDQEEIESKGIISVNRHIGSNTLGLSASTIAILKNLEMVNNFLQSWFDNPKSNFFDFVITNIFDSEFKFDLFTWPKGIRTAINIILPMFAIGIVNYFI